MVSPQRTVGEGSAAPIALRGLLVAAAVAFALASLVHSGVMVAIGPVMVADPFPGAVIPEAVIAFALGVGAASVIASWPGNRWLAFGATILSLLLTIYGLTVTVRSARTGDIVYHVAVLVALVVIAGLLGRSRARH